MAGSFAKYILIIVIVAGIAIGAYLLWQRQPKTKIEEKTEVPASQEAKPEEKVQRIISIPADNSVVTSQKLKFSGTSTPNTYLAIYTGSFQSVIKTDASGNFEKELTVLKGLNLINVSTFAQDLKPDKNENLTIYVPDKNDRGPSVFAGSIKTILDTAITIASSKNDQNIKTSTATDFSGVKDAKEATATASKLARIGDYIIALGTVKGKDLLDAKSVEIIRDNKPQNTESIIVGKISKAPTQNVFSAANKDGAIMDFAINKNSDISVNDKDGTSRDITKDKTAFIFYHTESGKNIADLVYLIP